MNIKQLQDQLAKLQAENNSRGLDDFLGLSPDQMHLLLYGRLEDVVQILSFNPNFDPGLIENVPIVCRVALLIKLIGEVGEVRATKQGNLPLKIVKPVFACHARSDFPIQSEMQSLDLLALRHIVTKCGWLKKRNQKFSLTKKGEEILEQGFTPSNYIVLLRHWIKNYNWSFTDAYPPCPIVQQAVIFLLYILREKAGEFLQTKQYVELFLKAFPMALAEIPINPGYPIPADEQLESIIRVRFLDRFASYFGLVQYVEDPNLPYLERDKKSMTRTTKLFSEVFTWFLAAKAQPQTVFNETLKDYLH